MKKEKFELLKDVESLLTYHIVSGMTEYPLSQGLLDFQKYAHEDVKKTRPSATSSYHGGEKSNIGSVEKDAATGIAELAEEIKRCEGCELCQSRSTSTPGEGGKRSKLLIVGGWLIGEDGNNMKDKIFGEHEDVMLAKMLQAIQVERSEAFVTNVIKCAIPSSVQPKSEHFKACSSYLYRQIRILQPRVICTMGVVATHALLRNSLPLSQLRGKFYSYHFDEKKAVPVMPTYHPSFLLQNPEMKMATWNDLQKIERKLNSG